MNIKQKNFLDDFGQLLRKYNINSMQVQGEQVCFFSNSDSLKIGSYHTVGGGNPKFRDVIADYVPEDERCTKLFEESDLNND